LKHVKQWLMALGALSTMNAACAARVIDQGQGPTATTPSALAMRLRDLPAANENNAAVVLTSDMDPDSLMLFFSPDGQTCSAPALPPFFLGGDPPAGPCDATNPRWQTILVIPPALDQFGMINLGDPRITEYAQEVLQGCGYGSRVGSGAMWSGTVDLVSSDAASLTLTLSGGVNAMVTVIDGDYVAQRCP